jgi:hypothetical protein
MIDQATMTEIEMLVKQKCEALTQIGKINAMVAELKIARGYQALVRKLNEADQRLKEICGEQPIDTALDDVVHDEFQDQWPPPQSVL